MSSDFFKSNKLPTRKLDKVSKLANAFVSHKIEDFLVDLELQLKVNSEPFVWDRSKARKVIGEQMALAYAMGALDKHENKDLTKVIYHD